MLEDRWLATISSKFLVSKTSEWQFSNTVLGIKT